MTMRLHTLFRIVKHNVAYVWYLIKRVREPGPGNGWKQGRQSLINQHKRCIVTRQLGSSNILRGISTSVQPLSRLVAAQCEAAQSTFWRLRFDNGRSWINGWNFEVQQFCCGCYKPTTCSARTETFVSLAGLRKSQCRQYILMVWEFSQFALSTSSSPRFIVRLVRNSEQALENVESENASFRSARCCSGRTLQFRFL